MIIKKIHVENFGKLHDLNISFENGINEFYCENGFGKTTLSIFIKSMFYGMLPARENIKMERKKYMPWQGGNFGGFLEFSHKENEYRITRYFAKTPEGDFFELLDLSTNKKVDLQGIEPGNVIWGVGKETFEMTAFFPQLNFSISTNEQMSANLLGLDKFKYDLANLNTAIVQIKKKITEIKREKPPKSELEDIKRTLQDYQAELSNLESRLKQINIELSIQQAKLVDKEEQVLKKKRAFDLEQQRAVQKQVLEEEMRAKQSELNILLLKLNELNNKEKEEANLHKHKKQKSQVLQISLAIVGILCLIAGVVIGILDISVAFMIVSFACALILVGADFCLFFANKQKNKENVSVSEERVSIENKVLLCNQQIAILEKGLEMYSDCNNPNLGELEISQTGLYQEKSNLQSLNYESETLKQKIDNLIEKVDNLKSEYDTKVEIYNSTTKKLELLALTKDYLMQANENVSKRFVEPANKAIKEVLSKFEIRGREFVVDTNFDVKEITAIGVKEQEYSSQGYQDILAFCVRIYLLKEIYKLEKPFIILDDTFVNLDDENMERVRVVMQELQNEYQIIYLCCNSRCKMK